MAEIDAAAIVKAARALVGAARQSSDLTTARRPPIVHAHTGRSAVADRRRADRAPSTTTGQSASGSATRRVWTDDEHVAALIANRLGWLDLPAHFADEVEALEAFAAGDTRRGLHRRRRVRHGRLVARAGVLAQRRRHCGDGGIAVDVLDSTDPIAVRAATAATDPAGTLYVISRSPGRRPRRSRSWPISGTLEDEIHRDIPAEASRRSLRGRSPTPRQSVDVTSRTSTSSARCSSTRRTSAGATARCPTLASCPAALMGLDLRALLDDAQRRRPSAAERSSANNPGLWLGVALGALARAGRDKLTLVIEPRFARLGMWIEQLVAESTGKRGVGIVPVDGEALGDAGRLRRRSRLRPRLDRHRPARGRRQPTPRSTRSPRPAIRSSTCPCSAASGALGGEFFRWEFATAVAGAVLGINPFDEPNVTESKDNTKRVLDQLPRRAQAARR